MSCANAAELGKMPLGCLRRVGLQFCDTVDTQRLRFILTILGAI